MTGALAVEVGEGQAEAEAELMREAGFGEVEIRADLAGIERVVVGRSVKDRG
jgi:methylase of polypeptide subunit release factors